MSDFGSRRTSVAGQVRLCAVVGAGPAGLGAAGEIARRGIVPVVLERYETAGSWRRRYDRVHLNTSTWFSHLPGYRFPSDYPLFPSRDQLVSYYDEFAKAHNLEVHAGVSVDRIEKANGNWRIATSDGALETKAVVVATGKDHTPKLPDVPGREGFGGQLIHAAEYRNAEPFHGSDALVLGGGNSGVEIATDLAEGGAGKVRLSIRTPPNLLRRSTVGLPNDLFAVIGRRLPPPVVDAIAWRMRRLTLGDLSPYGLSRPPEGPYARLRRTGMIPTVDSGPFLRALKGGAIDVVAGVERFEGRDVVLAGGQRIRPGLVVAATGYRTDLEPLVGHLGVLDDRGRPTFHAEKTHPSAPRLHFIGFTDPLSGNIRQTRLDAPKIAQAISSALS